MAEPVDFTDLGRVKFHGVQYDMDRMVRPCPTGVLALLAIGCSVPAAAQVGYL